MTTTRRGFLGQLGAASLVSIGAAPPAFLCRLAHAVEQQRAPADAGRVLVLVQLAGGNDGLNTVIPYADPEYYKARPGIAIPKASVLRLNDQLGLHPQMTGMKELYDDGALRIVQGVGYPNPDRSHFRSMDIWQTARPDMERAEDGWLGRALDRTAEDSLGGMPALALGMDRLPLSLVSAKVNVPTVRDLAAYQLHLGAGSESNRKQRGEAIQQLARRWGVPGSNLEFLSRTAEIAYSSAERLRTITESYKPAASYPASHLGKMLKLVAQIIASDLGTRICFVSLDGFDTHSQQLGAHQALLMELSAALRAFQLDLKGHKLEDRVLLATFSEFGRRVKENGSLGTDHGAASQMFVVGPPGRGGVHGVHPSLTDLIDGDLKHHTDFRSVYATLLEAWLQIPSQPVLGGKFQTVELV